MSRKFAIMDVFTDTATTGNQLGVVYDSDGLSTPEMQKIAREFNFSETIFLEPSSLEGCDSKVRIFTPANELPFAGHPTVGAAIAVAEVNGLSDGESTNLTLEENVGPVQCRIKFEGGKRYAEFDLPVIAQETEVSGETSSAAAGLSLDLTEIGMDNHTHSSFHAGLPYDLVPVKDLKTIGRANPNMQHWHAGFGTHSHNSAFVYCRETVEPENDFHARMFAPDAGIPEDPATGSAVASFAGAIAKFENLSDGTHSFRIEQGVEMGRASLITLSLEMNDGVIQSGSIGGNAVVFATGILA